MGASLFMICFQARPHRACSATPFLFYSHHGDAFRYFRRVHFPPRIRRSTLRSCLTDGIGERELLFSSWSVEVLSCIKRQTMA